MRPPKPPISAFKDAIEIIREEGVEERRRIDKGAIFCQVDKRKQRGQVIEFITDGNHK